MTKRLTTKLQLGNKPLLAIMVLIVVILGACNSKLGKSNIDEGVITYKITYLVSESENPLISLLPSQIKMYFKDDNVSMSIEGWMGIFKSSFIKISKKDQAITLLKMLNKKYYYECKTPGDFMGMSGYTKPIIEFDDLEKEILGYQCKHAIVTIEHANITFDIYYTNQIDVKNPNQHTLYEQIDGMLMEFQIEMNGIPMKLVATEIINTNVDDIHFEIPADYNCVDKEEIDKIFNSLTS